MPRQRASEFSQDLLELYDRFAHDLISRREFLERAGKYAVGGLSAAAILDSLSPQYALANQIDAKDSRIKTQYLEYPSPKGHGKVRAYLTRPSASGKLPGVVVIHENRGLNPYIEDVARRLAVAGFLAAAPDGLTSLGGYPGNDDAGRDMQRKLDGNKLLEDFIAGFAFVKAHPDCSGKVGVVGFCYGGGVVNEMAVRLPDLAAAVPFYGSQPATQDVPKIRSPLLLHYAALDERINKGWPEFEQALKTHGKRFTAHMYPDVNHGFHNDTTPRYDERAATLAWQRTLEFFKINLT